MRSSNPRVRQEREEYFERIRQGMDGSKDCYVPICNATAGIIVRCARCRVIVREVISGLQFGDE